MSSDGSPVVPVSETAEAPREALHVRYFSLLKNNPNFRRLWMAQLVSELGDWFYSLAIYDLLFSLTHSGKAVSYAIIVQTLPWFFMTPLAGGLADRFSRRWLMIASDIVQGVVVLGMLFVHNKSEVWLVYVLLALEVVFASIFEPARNALLPNLTTKEELHAANALSSATWSVALTMGAALGGVVTAFFGRPVAFIVDSISFFASALFIERIRLTEPHLDSKADSNRGATRVSHVDSVVETFQYLKKNVKALSLVVTAVGRGLLGGVLLLLVAFGEKVFPVASSGVLSAGLLYTARGVGAGVGPFLGDHLTRGSQGRMWKSIPFGFFVVGVSYALLSRAPSLLFAAVAVCFAHMGGSHVWVVCTTLLQLNTDDRLRGRIFALEIGLLMLAVSASNYLIGVGLDTWKLSPSQLALVLGLVMLTPGFIWLLQPQKWGEGRNSIPSQD